MGGGHNCEILHCSEQDITIDFHHRNANFPFVITLTDLKGLAVDLCGIDLPEKQTSRKRVVFTSFCAVYFFNKTISKLFFSLYRLFKESFRRICRL